MRRVRHAILAVVLLIVAALAAGAFWVRGQLSGSLPRLDGDVRLAGLSGPVAVTRDALGVPTIRGATREDVARATGFVHGQDRFFQMDLARRRAAGELAALVGEAAVEADREIRVHRFRSVAADALPLMAPRDRMLLEAYAAGVNAALAAMTAPPFEYLLLRQAPEAWRPEDSLLVVLAMFVTLQDSDGGYESTLATMHDVLPREMYEFLAPRGTEWDSPVIGRPFAVPPIPGPAVYDLRERRRNSAPGRALPDTLDRTQISDASASAWWPADGHPDAAIGSNNFAVAGALTDSGGALVANDMHLGIRVPNTWYRAVLEWAASAAPADATRLAGVTLPGVPALIVGSNTHVAWGFTNTYADWSDVVLLETDPADPGRYRTPDGWRRFERHDEVIRVAGKPDQHVEVTWTIWGPVLPPDYRGRPRAYRWVAHDAARLASTVAPFEDARTIEEAMDVANGLGTPGQNMVVGDASGRIGWSVFGSIPRRVGLDGQLPTSWADGTRGWSGWLADEEFPRVVDPEGGRLWTANARVVDGEMLAKLGDGGYEIGSRARVIRERLRGRERFAPRDMLAIQLDAGADFLERWRDVILRTLDNEAVAGHPLRAEFRRIVEREWTGVAAPDSAAYRLTRAFRDAVSQRVIAFVLSDCYDADPEFDYTFVRRRDGPIWVLVTEQPMHLLDPAYDTWEELLLSALDATVEAAMRDHSGTLAERVWSEYNRPGFRHPLSAAVPLIGRWLDMPPRALPGDLYTPRVSWRAIAASERMVVSPGREEGGILQMPTGQSGHPWSPFYANSHDAWVRGEPTPFLPGPAVHTLTLTP
jgi:penicillin amidase